MSFWSFVISIVRLSRAKKLILLFCPPNSEFYFSTKKSYIFDLDENNLNALVSHDFFCCHLTRCHAKPNGVISFFLLLCHLHDVTFFFCLMPNGMARHFFFFAKCTKIYYFYHYKYNISFHHKPQSFLNTYTIFSYHLHHVFSLLSFPRMYCSIRSMDKQVRNMSQKLTIIIKTIIQNKTQHEKN